MAESIFKYDGVIWSLPLLFQYEPVYAALVRTFEAYDIKLPEAYLYGSPASVWSGGRPPAIFDKFDRTRLENTFKYVKSFNAVPSFTFSCTDISKEALNDSYANFLLDVAFEFDARFIVYSDLLKDYIKSQNPKARVVASVIKPALHFQGPDKKEAPTIENEARFYNKLLKEYDIVVVRPEFSKKVLQEHPDVIDDISRIEVLINQPCLIECPKMPEHYRFMEKQRVNRNQDPNNRFICVREGIPKRISCKNSVAHSEKEVGNLVNNGVKHLKLQGRSDNFEMTSLLLLLFGQMFNQDGENFMLAYDLAQNSMLFKELENFVRQVKK